MAKAGKCPDHLKAKRVAYDRTRSNSSQRGYGADWQRFREYLMHYVLWQRYDARCAICKLRFIEGRDVHWDHIIPLSKGGARLDESNVQPTCVRCNTAKGDSVPGVVENFSN